MYRNNKTVCYSIAHGGSAAYLIPNGQDFSDCSCWSHCHHGYTQVGRKAYLSWEDED